MKDIKIVAKIILLDQMGPCARNIAKLMVMRLYTQ